MTQFTMDDEYQQRLEGQRWHCAGRITADQYNEWVQSPNFETDTIFFEEETDRATFLVHFERSPFGVQMVYQLDKRDGGSGLMWAGPAINRGCPIDVTVQSVQVIEKGYTALVSGEFGDESKISFYNPYHLRDRRRYEVGGTYTFLIGGFVYQLYAVDRPPYDWRRERKLTWMKRSDVRASPLRRLFGDIEIEMGWYSKGCIASTKSMAERPGDVVMFAPLTSITRFDWGEEPMFEASITAFRTFEHRFDIPFWGIAETVQADWPMPGEDVDAWVWLQGFLDK